ncbi:alpha/beta fold hydrolase [Sphingomonas sp. PAMC 26605]|uniref:alpha/beta fold hydrolase n=1 Tax=Sphingomonas sp. PAMC 26605 TaxID=1112214 RepID=UPI00026CB5B7|nr:alpha/beta fold hydrolase [Sphingomonas sp. PAMC 26605]
MAHIVLVHGSWHGKWCWELVTPLLEEKGHVVHALDLPGMGSDPTPLGSVTLETWSVWLEGYLRQMPEPAILVGHSRGGPVISCTAERAPECVAKLVYLAALLLQDGESCLDLYSSETPPEAILSHPDMIQIAKDGTSTLDPKSAGACFYNLTPPDLARRAAARLGPEPHWVLSEPIRVTADRFGAVPRAYIETTQDESLAIALQRKMYGALTCAPVISLNTDHSPFLSSPKELADAINDLAVSART